MNDRLKGYFVRDTMFFGRLLVGFIVCFFGISFGLFFTETNTGLVGFQEFEDVSLKEVLYLLSLPAVMMLGMLAKAIHSEMLSIKEGDSVDISLCLQKAFSSAGFWKSVLVSPIVFMGVYLVIKEQPDPMISYLLCFENGFFWRAVFESRNAKYEGG